MKKHEREIRELLEKMDTFLPDNPTPERSEREKEPKKKVVGVMPPAPRPIPIRPSQSVRFSKWLRAHKISTALACIIGGFALVITGLIINEFVARQNSSLLWVGQVFVAAGAILYLVPVLARFFSGRDLNDSDDGPKYWRGQATNEGFSWQSVQRWFQARKSGPGNDRKRNRW